MCCLPRGSVEIKSQFVWGLRRLSRGGGKRTASCRYGILWLKKRKDREKKRGFWSFAYGHISWQNTSCHPIAQVKQRWVWSILRWITAREYQVMLASRQAIAIRRRAKSRHVCQQKTLIWGGASELTGHETPAWSWVRRTTACSFIFNCSANLLFIKMLSSLFSRAKFCYCNRVACFH